MVLRIFKMIATSGFLTALECTKFVFGRALPRTPLGQITVLLRHPSWFKEPYFQGEGEGGRGKRERGREGRDPHPFAISWIRP